MTLWRPGLLGAPLTAQGECFSMFLPFWVCFSVSALLGLFIWSPGTGRVAPVLALAAATWLVRCHIDPTCIILTV